MKRLLLIILIWCPLLIWAKYVTPEMAQQVARNFASQNVVNSELVKRTPLKTPSLKLSSKRITDNPQYYIFNYDDNDGYIIVAADDIAIPILGFSDNGNIDNIPKNLRWWLSDYDREIQWAIEQGIETTEETTEEWAKLLSSYTLNTAEVVVAPLIKTEWSQGSGYNSKCPYDTQSSSYCKTGCVATAMAQIMKYWEHPKKGRGRNSYIHETYGELSADFGSTTYDWDNMPNDLGMSSTSTQINAIATLMYHCGVAVGMRYGVSASGANIRGAAEGLRDFFFYSDEAKFFSKDDFSDTDWKERIKVQLLLGRPILYGGTGSDAHAFICDGYRSDNYFHFNWGWDVGADGYYSLSALKPNLIGLPMGDFTNFQQALLCLYPKTDTTARAVLELMENINLNDSIVCGNEWQFTASISNVGEKEFSGYIYAVVYQYIDSEIPTALLRDSIYVEELYDEDLHFELKGVSDLSTGKYFVQIEYRNTLGELQPVGYDYFVNFKKVIVYNPIEMDLLYRFTWGGTREHWFTGDSIRFLTQINNNESEPFVGFVTMKLESTDDKGIFHYFDSLNLGDWPIAAHGDEIIGVDGKLDVPAGTYKAYLLYKNNISDNWKLVGCAPGLENPLSLIVESPIEKQKYVILAQRKSTSNWYYLTSVNAGTEYTPHLEAVNSGTADRNKIKTSDLEDKYIWQIDTTTAGLLLKNGDVYVSYTKGNTAYMSTSGQLLQDSKTANDLVQYWFIDSNEITRYLSLNTNNDYFSFYTGTQAQNLLVIRYGVEMPITTQTNGLETESSCETYKILRDGQLLIKRGEKIYSITGARLQ